MVKYCILCGKPIEVHEPYHFFQDDLDPNAIRAHDRHIEQDPYRWIEIGRQLGPSLAGVVAP